MTEEKIWNPNISLKKWLKMYPVVCECGKELEAIPYVSSICIGVESKDCSCGLKSGYISVFHKDKKKNKEALEAMKEINKLVTGE